MSEGYKRALRTILTQDMILKGPFFELLNKKLFRDPLKTHTNTDHRQVYSNPLTESIKSEFRVESQSRRQF